MKPISRILAFAAAVAISMPMMVSAQENAATDEEEI